MAKVTESWFQSSRAACRIVGIALLSTIAVAGQQNSGIELFNGRDLAGWVEVGGSGIFTVQDGSITAAPPGPAGTWLRTENEYENFRLRLEYLTPDWCEAGLLLFAPPHGRASHVGLKLHLRHDNLDEGNRSVGALYDVLPPLRHSGREAGEWNQLEILSDWPRLQVRLNGDLIQDVHRDLHPDLRWRKRRGYLGLQYLGSTIRFRNLHIEPLPDRDLGWIQLHQGRDLSGWEVQGEAPWRVDQGTIISDGGDGYLISRDSYSRFIFQVMVRTSPQANGGVFFRWGGDNGRGYEAQLYNVADATNPTGSIYAVAPARDLRSRDEEWFHFQIVSAGASAMVFVNGDKVAESHRLTLPDEGRIALQMHSQGRIEFFQPRVRSLSQEPADNR